jgi:hypothetical protein
LELVSVRIERPSAPGRARLVGEVVYDRAHEADQYWFDVPESSADLLTTSGNPFLACLLPLAVTRREPIRLCAPVDRVLLENARRLMEVWAGWYPHLKPAAIHAETIPPLPFHPPPREAACMFSGGVDSFFTILREDAPDRAGCPKIDRLFAVWGFDIGLEKPEEFDRHRRRLQAAADQMGKTLVDVATNLKGRRFREANWGRHSHGSALSSVALALEKGIYAVYIAPSLGRAQPWGSHPDTDPLHSTSRLRIIHDAPEASRWRRVEFVTHHPVAMRNLHVCPRGGTSRNCGECRKCYVLKLMLELMGTGAEGPTFETPGIDLARVRRLYAKKPTYSEMLTMIRDKAREAGREDIAEAAEGSIAKTVRRQRWIALGEPYATTKGLWRAARFWRRTLLRDFVQ